MADSARPLWEEEGGIRLVRLPTADDDFAVLLEETWSRHVLVRHPYLQDHYGKVVQTLSRPDDIHECRTNPQRLVYRKWYNGQGAIPGHCGANPTLLVFVNRGNRTLASAYFVDFDGNKLGKRLWPKKS